MRWEVRGVVARWAIVGFVVMDSGVLLVVVLVLIGDRGRTR